MIRCQCQQRPKEPLADDQFPPRLPPRLIGQIANRVTSERQQVQGRQHGREIPVAVPEIVLEIVALGFQRVEGLVLDPRLRGDKPSTGPAPPRPWQPRCRDAREDPK